MKRTAATVLFTVVSLIGTAAAQKPADDSAKAAQPDAIGKVVGAMQEAEKGLSSLRMTLRTKGHVQGGLQVETTGELRVLRGTQADAGERLYVRLEYSFGDGLKGRQETARTADGIVQLEQDSAFGAVLLRFDAAVVRDLEWAGGVLKRSDMPGMSDGRAQSPLGSGTVRDLRRTFDLKIGARKERDGEAGTWIEGKRKQGLDEQDPDLPVADRVELFVRDADHALLSARYFVGDDVVQEITIEKLELGVELGDDAFVVDGGGLELRDVRSYTPMWEQIEQVLEKAESKAGEGVVRPSKR